MTPTVETALWVCRLFGRKDKTHWSDKEVVAYRKLAKAGFFDSADDRALIDQYYAFQRKKGTQGIHRRDLCTFLNNAWGELDRARAWREEHPLKPVPKVIIQMPLAKTEPYVAPTDPEEIERLARFKEELRLRKLNRA